MVCVSLHQSLNSGTNIAIGKALRPFREDGILILGSGFTFHNMQAFFHPSDASHKASRNFNQWLKKSIIEGQLESLKEWEQAPGARLCHPREEHLMPLLVVAGSALVEESCEVVAQIVYDNSADLDDHAVSSYLFGSQD